MRFRSRKDFDVRPFPPEDQYHPQSVLKKYGMIVADHGQDWFITGAPDKKWNPDRLTVAQSQGQRFEVVDTGPVEGPKR